jgi:hypothetical protein
MSEPTFTATATARPAELEPGDALIGGRAIWRYRNELLGTACSLSLVFKLLQLGEIPAKRTRSGYIGSKRALRQFYAAGTGLAA